LYLKSPATTAITPTNRWGVYQEDADHKNFFAGNLVLGGQIEQTPATLDAGEIGFTQTWTHPNVAGDYIGHKITNATTGANADLVKSLDILQTAGYSGSGLIVGINSRLQTASTGESLNMDTGSLGNVAIQGLVNLDGSSAGLQVGVFGGTLGGNINRIGVMGATAGGCDSGFECVGVAGFIRNAGASTTMAAGYFSAGFNNDPWSDANEKPNTKAVLITNNGTQAMPIFIAQDAGTDVFTIADGGNVIMAEGTNLVMGTTTGTTNSILQIFSESGLALIQIKNGGNGSDTGLTVLRAVDVGDPALIKFEKARGTLASTGNLTAAEDGFGLMKLDIRGQIAGSQQESAFIQATVDGSVGTRVPTRLEWGVGTSSAGPVIKMTMANDGGLFMAGATGSSQGSGTINAVSVFDDSVLLTDFVFEEDYEQLSIDEMEEFYIKEKHLPTIDGREVWESEGRFSVGKVSQQVWETVEVQAKYIAELNQRLKVLEASCLGER